MAGLAGLALVLAAGVPAEAAVGPVAAAAYGFVAKLEIGVPGSADARACSGALVRPRVVLTARDCLVSAAHPDPAGGSALAITARFPTTGIIPVVDVRPDVAPGLSLAVLARPATVGAVPFDAQTPVAGDVLTAAGFGRTSDTWISDQPHTASFTVRQAGTAGIGLTPAADAGLCRGDAGAPVLRQLADGKLQLAGVATAASQKGCLGAADTSGDATAVSPASLASLPAAGTDPFDQVTLSPTDSGRASIAGEGFGAAVATADFNKDGFLDIAVGAPTDRTGTNRDVASGTVTVFSGGADGPGTGKVLLQAAFGASDEAGDRFGSSLTTADFNKDGYADLAIGTPGEQIGSAKAGAVAVFYGSSGNLGKGEAFDQSSLGLTNVTGDEFGTAIAAGDFNADGFADLAVGAPGKTIGSAKSGQVFVIKGSSGGLLKSATWVVDQRATNGTNENNDRFGAALAAGNVLGAKSGTVYADLVVGAPGEAPGPDPQSGMVYVIPGSASGPVANAVDFSQTGNGGSNELGDKFGAALATGDFDKDGWADVVVGTPGEASGDLPQSGALSVFAGGSTTVAKGYAVEERDFAGGANEAGDLFGSVFATGDVNADGYSDLLAAAPGKAGAAGVAYSFLGGPRGAARPESLLPAVLITQSDVYDTSEANDRFGAALAVGDLNRDGRADVVIGASGEGAPGQPDAGRVTVLTRGVG